MTTANAVNNYSTATGITTGGTGVTSVATTNSPLTGGATSTSAIVAPYASIAGQVVASGGSSNTSYWARPDYIKISSQAASSSATLDFTGLTSTYSAYMFILQNILPATAGDILYVRISFDGSTWINAAAAYVWINQHGRTGGNTTEIQCNSSGTSNAANTGISGTFEFFTPGAAINQGCIWHFGTITNTPAILCCVGVGGQINANSAVQGVRFLFSTGAIASGTINSYGVY